VEWYGGMIIKIFQMYFLNVLFAPSGVSFPCTVYSWLLVPLQTALFYFRKKDKNKLKLTSWQK
jgi:hypothetical protein